MKDKLLTDTWVANRLEFEALESIATLPTPVSQDESQPEDFQLPYIPLEILLMIFAALEDIPRVVMIEKLTLTRISRGLLANPGDAYRTRYCNGVPATLHINRLTRNMALRKYQPLFGSVDQHPKFFQPETDVLYLKNCGSEIARDVSRYLDPDLMKVQHLRISDRWNTQYYWAPILVHFKNLKTLTAARSGLKHRRSSKPHLCSITNCESFRSHHSELQRCWEKMFNPVPFNPFHVFDELGNIAIPDQLLPPVPELYFMDTKKMGEEVPLTAGPVKVVERRKRVPVICSYDPGWL